MPTGSYSRGVGTGPAGPATARPVMEYLGRRNIWTPRSHFAEIFAPP